MKLGVVKVSVLEHQLNAYPFKTLGAHQSGFLWHSHLVGYVTQALSRKTSFTKSGAILL